jgi:hypothetical protein
MSKYFNVSYRGAILCFIFLLAGMGVKAQGVRYNGGISYLTGSYYFGEKTGTLYFSNGFNMGFDRLSFSVNVPFVVQTTPWISYSPYGAIPTGGTENGEVKRAGSGHAMVPGSGHRRHIDLADTVSYARASFSDPSVQAGFRIYSGRDGKTTLILNGHLKFPISTPSSGYGTGAWDSGTGFSLSQSLGYTWMVFADATWWWLGDMEDLNLNNSLAYGVGVGKIFTETGWLVNASLSGFTTIVDNYDPPLTLTFGTGYKADTNIFLNATTGFGLSESSPGFSAGFGWSVAF